MNKKGLTCLFGFFLLFACVGCSLPTFGDPPYTTAKVFTWEDVNKNGLLDKGELPIPFVTTGGIFDVLTGADGWGYPSFQSGCIGNCGSISVKIPPGYKPTTPTQQVITGDSNVYFFGFYIENKNAIVSFPNEPEWQKSFIYRGTKVLAFHYFGTGELKITVDRNGSVPDGYYPTSRVTDDKYYFDYYIFNVIKELYYGQNIKLTLTHITLMPSKSVFLCFTGVIAQYTYLSGDIILTQHCEGN